MPMKKEQQKKGGMTTCTLGGNTIHVLFLLTITLLLLLNHTTHAILCSSSKLQSGYPMPIPKNTVTEATSGVASSGTEFCVALYNIAGKKSTSIFIPTPYMYVAGADADFLFDFCNEPTAVGACRTKNSTATIVRKELWRLDFVCCCNDSKRCNEVDTMNPQKQFNKQLNETDQQICLVKNGTPKRIDNCTRRTNLSETQSPSKCRSVLQGSQQTLGCAHDGVSDRCSWTSTYPQRSGVCREIPGEGGIECCCEGAYCNGLEYMDLGCRSKITAPNTSNKFIYGDGDCKAVWPPNTPTVDTTDGPANKGDSSGNKNGAPNTETSTGTTGSDHTMLIVGVIAAVVVVVIIIIVVGLVIFFWYRRKKARKSKGSESKPKQEADGDELSGVTIGVDRRTDSEREEDNYQPRILINPAEKADELRRLGNQAAGTSVTINPNEGSDFGDHTEARGGVFDDDSEAAPTTTGKATNQTNTNMTTSTKATKKTEPPSTNKSTQKKKKSAKEKDKGR